MNKGCVVYRSSIEHTRVSAKTPDLENHELAEDLAWTFNTEPIELTDLPEPPSDSNLESEPIELEPTFELTANTVLDLDLLKSHVKLLPAGQEQSVPVTVKLLEDEPEEQRD